VRLFGSSTLWVSLAKSDAEVLMSAVSCSMSGLGSKGKISIVLCAEEDLGLPPLAVLPPEVVLLDCSR